MKCSPAMNFCASILAFLVFINEILRKIVAENIRRIELLNEKYEASFSQSCRLSCYKLLWKSVIWREDEDMGAQKTEG